MIKYQVAPDILEDEILERITEEEIWKFYIPEFEKPDKQFSLRSNDNNPSARISYYNGRLWLKDFGDVHQDHAETVFQFVSRIYNINYHDAVNLVFKDLNVGKLDRQKYHNDKIIQEHIPTIINIKKRHFIDKDMLFWSQYGITQYWLQKACIFPISHFWIKSKNTNGESKQFMTNFAFSYDYYWHNNVFRRKIYQPYKEDGKWISNVDTTIIQGWHMLPKEGGDILIITSSYKDSGTIYCNTGIHSIAPNNEGSFIPEKVLEKLKKKWNKIYIWFDNDFNKPTNEGLFYAKKFSNQYDIPYIITPNGTEKDPSDYRSVYGRYAFIKLIKELL